jgi:hypothetical protein
MRRRFWQRPRKDIPPVFTGQQLTPGAVRAITRETALDRRFRGVDRFLLRWAVGQGSGFPPADGDDLPPESRPSPLPEIEAIAVDQIILHSPPWFQDFVHGWYRSPKPREIIAKELAISERSVYLERKIVLAYFLGRFTEAGIPVPAWEPDS